MATWGPARRPGKDGAVDVGRPSIAYSFPRRDQALRYLPNTAHAPCSQVSSGGTLSPQSVCFTPSHPVTTATPARTSIFTSVLACRFLISVPPLLHHTGPLVSGLEPGPSSCCGVLTVSFLGRGNTILELSSEKNI